MPAAPKTSNVVSIRVVNSRPKTIFNFLARFSMITLYFFVIKIPVFTSTFKLLQINETVLPTM